jgi:PX domain
MCRYPAYKLKLPPKRIFFHAVSADFVEERREQLDTYLRLLLGDPNLCRERTSFPLCTTLGLTAYTARSAQQHACCLHGQL